MRDAVGVDPGVRGQPGQGGVAVLEGGRERVLGGQAVVHRGHDTARGLDEGPTEPIVLGRGPDDHAATVDPDEARMGPSARRRTVYPHGHLAHLDDLHPIGPAPLHEARPRPDQGQRAPPDSRSREEPRDPAQLRMERRCPHEAMLSIRPARARQQGDPGPWVAEWCSGRRATWAGDRCGPWSPTPTSNWSAATPGRRTRSAATWASCAASTRSASPPSTTSTPCSPSAPTASSTTRCGPTSTSWSGSSRPASMWSARRPSSTAGASATVGTASSTPARGADPRCSAPASAPASWS